MRPGRHLGVGGAGGGLAVLEEEQLPGAVGLRRGDLLFEDGGDQRFEDQPGAGEAQARVAPVGVVVNCKVAVFAADLAAGAGVGSTTTSSESNVSVMGGADIVDAGGGWGTTGAGVALITGFSMA